METKQKIKWGVVVGYLIGFFTLISSILFGVVHGLFAVLGVCAFIGTGIIALIRYFVKDWSKQRGRAQAKALVWELKDQLEQFKEQLSRGVITQEEYEQKRKLLESQLEEVKSRAQRL
jgi:Na+-translocating ferredoxin:NAD+ oxidoreductase RnfG subunit